MALQRVRPYRGAMAPQGSRHPLPGAIVFLALALGGCAGAPEETQDEPGNGTTNGTMGTTPTPTTLRSSNGTTPGNGTIPANGTTPTTGGTVLQGTTGRVASAPGAPVALVLEVVDAEAFFAQGSAATLTVSGMATERLRAGIVLPEGVERVEGDVAYEGPLSADTPLRLRSVLRATASGEHVLRAWAEAPLGVGSRAAPSVLLAVRGSADDARFETRPQPEPQFSVTLKASSEDPRNVTATLTARASAQARLVFLVPDAFPNMTGTHDEPLGLVGGETTVRTLELGTAETWPSGYATLSVYLYPDAAVDGRLYGDALYYWWQEGSLRVSETPPSTVPAGGGQGPGASSGSGNGTAPQSTG